MLPRAVLVVWAMGRGGCCGGGEEEDDAGCELHLVFVVGSLSGEIAMVVVSSGAEGIRTVLRAVEGA